MGQIQKWFSDKLGKALQQGHCRRRITPSDFQDMPGIEKSRFVALLRAYRQNPLIFCIAYGRTTPARLSAALEPKSRRILLHEKQIIETPGFSVYDHDYTALRDRLKNKEADAYTAPVTMASRAIRT